MDGESGVSTPLASDDGRGVPRGAGGWCPRTGSEDRMGPIQEKQWKRLASLLQPGAAAAACLSRWLTPPSCVVLVW